MRGIILFCLWIAITLRVDPVLALDNSVMEIQQLVERQAQAWSSRDSEKIIADFAEDCVFIAPSVRVQGKESVKKLAEDFFKSVTEVNIQIHRIIEQGNQGAIEWSWSEVSQETGQRSEAEDAIIFELDKGKIKYWREYIDQLKSS